MKLSPSSKTGNETHSPDKHGAINETIQMSVSRVPIFLGTTVHAMDFANVCINYIYYMCTRNLDRREACWPANEWRMSEYAICTWTQFRTMHPSRAQPSDATEEIRKNDRIATMPRRETWEHRRWTKTRILRIQFHFQFTSCQF